MCYCTPEIRTPCCGKPDCHPRQTVVDIESARPHLTINCGKTVHVVPVGLIESIIKGDDDFSTLDDGKVLLQTILKEWLEQVQTVSN